MKNPYWVFYTHRFVRLDALTVGPFILVKPEYKEDKALLVHELVHVAQFYRWWGLNGLLYVFSKKWRLRLEVEAYRAQLRYRLATEDTNEWWLAKRYANTIVENYNIGVDRDAVIRMLLGQD